MRRDYRFVARPAAWLASLALWLPAGLCLAQQEPGDDTRVPMGGPVRVSEYWLGLMSGPVPDALRAHLSLQENQGLLVELVAPASPAAAAAIQQYDVLLNASGKMLAKMEDLIAAIDAAKGKKMDLELLRKGKPMKVEVTPAKRPQGEIARLLPPAGVDPFGEAMRKWAEQFRPGDSRNRDYSFFLLRPGVVLARPGGVPDLPDNVTISITKQGKNPAKIAVTRDNQKWEVSAGDLDKLPPDIRPHVEWMLRHQLHGVVAPRFEGRLPPAASTPPVQPGPKAELRREKRPELRVSPEPPKPIEKQLEELSRRLEEMRKAVDDLKAKPAKSSGTAPAPQVEPPK
jgi:hypothetical protein